MKIKTRETRIKILSAMHELVINLNNENAYYSWIYIVPDGADMEDIIDIAEDDELYADAVELFKKIWNSYAKDGIYDGETVI